MNNFCHSYAEERGLSLKEIIKTFSDEERLAWKNNNKNQKFFKDFRFFISYSPKNKRVLYKILSFSCFFS